MSYRLVVRPEVDADLVEAEACTSSERLDWVASFFGLLEIRWTVCPPLLSFTRFVIVASKYVGSTFNDFLIGLSSE